jgi:hypothetical protein
MLAPLRAANSSRSTLIRGLAEPRRSGYHLSPLRGEAKRALRISFLIVILILIVISPVFRDGGGEAEIKIKRDRLPLSHRGRAAIPKFL